MSELQRPRIDRFILANDTNTQYLNNLSFPSPDWKIAECTVSFKTAFVLHSSVWKYLYFDSSLLADAAFNFTDVSPGTVVDSAPAGSPRLPECHGGLLHGVGVHPHVLLVLVSDPRPDHQRPARVHTLGYVFSVGDDNE